MQTRVTILLSDLTTDAEPGISPFRSNHRPRLYARDAIHMRPVNFIRRKNPRILNRRDAETGRPTAKKYLYNGATGGDKHRKGELRVNFET